MGLSGSLSGITFGGLASGIDSDTIVRRLIQLEALPIQRLQTQQATISARMGVLQQFKSKLTGLSVASGGLNSAAAFNPIAATSSKVEVATLSADSSATTGIYQLSVSKLAQSQKVSSNPQTDTTTALGISGTIIVNGKSLKVETTDTLRSVATKINGAGGGVTASLIDGGTGKAYLTLTATKSGAANTIQLADLDGSVLSTLGITGTTESFRDPHTLGGKSAGFTSSTTSLATQMGLSGQGTRQFKINDVAVNIDFSTATLSSIAAAINTSGSGAEASIVSETKNGVTVQRLNLDKTNTLEDADGLMKALGVLQRDFGTELVTGQDAAFKLDGVDITSESNSVTTAIPGATLTLLKANETTPETSVLSLSRDDAGIKKKMKDFMDAYNGVIDFVKTNSALDKETFQTGLLFGDASAQQVEASISSLVFNTVANVSGNYKNLAGLGFSFDSDGKLTLNEGTLDTALASDADAVGAVFRAIGSTTAAGLTYVSSNDKTRPSSATGFEINITELAAKGSYRAEVAQTGATTSSEELTFNGAAFGSTAYKLNIGSGKSQTDIVNLINNDTKLKDLVVATVDGGKLKIESKKYGTSSAFTVVSNLAAGATNSGIGTSSAGTTVAAKDLAGTINGKAATGNGQFLTGKEGDPEGLQIQYTGSSTGVIGNLKFSKGIGAQMTALVGTFNDTVNGLLTANDKSMQAQVDSITQSISGLQERLKVKESELKLKFSRMEQAIAKLQSQQAQFSSIR